MEKSTKILLSIIVIILILILGFVGYLIIDKKRMEDEINYYKSHGETYEKHEQQLANSIENVNTNTTNSIERKNTNTTYSVQTGKDNTIAFDSYINYWIDTTTNDSLVIYKINSNTIFFDLGIYRTYAIDDVTATIIGENKAKFKAEDNMGNGIEGLITFNKNSIKIETTNINGYELLNGNYERTFDKKDTKEFENFKAYNLNKIN